MRYKKGYMCALLALLILLLTACATAQTPQQSAAASVVTPIEANPAGLSVGQSITAKELDARREAGETFAVYFIGKTASDMEAQLQGNLSVLIVDYMPLFQAAFYTIPMEDYRDAKSILGGNLFGVAMFRGQEATLLTGDSRNDVSIAFNQFFENGLVAPDDHGLPIVTYEQVQEKIGGDEPFLLYIGRDTCPQCRLFAPNLEKGLAQASLKTPVLYFYTQDYETAINRREEGAQETWDGVKAALHIKGTPSLLYFKDGASSPFESFNNLFREDAKSPTAFDESNQKCVDALTQWLKDMNIE